MIKLLMYRKSYRCTLGPYLAAINGYCQGTVLPYFHLHEQAFCGNDSCFQLLSFDCVARLKVSFAQCFFS